MQSQYFPKCTPANISFECNKYPISEQMSRLGGIKYLVP